MQATGGLTAPARDALMTCSPTASRLAAGLTAVLVGLVLLPAPVAAGAGADASSDGTVARSGRTPPFADRVPPRTRQVVRTVSSRVWCSHPWCTVTQVWRKAASGEWRMIRRFRSSIAPNGFGKQHEGDMRSPSGVYRIRVTFSTKRHAPGPMPWRRRLPTSVVTNHPDRLYNTWIEERGRTDGDRLSMRNGFIVDYNNPRLRPGVGPRPVVGKGFGIFYHTLMPGHPWSPTEGCTKLGNPAAMRWLVGWLEPRAHPRVVQGP